MQKNIAKHNQKGQKLHKILSNMYKYIKKAKGEKLENTLRIKTWMRRAKNRIASWLSRDYNSKAVLNLILRMKKYINDWFTCLKYSFVEPTNNDSERDIRKSVIARKISGAHRSEQGLHSREVMMPTILTLEKRSMNPFQYIRNAIEMYNLRPN